MCEVALGHGAEVAHVRDAGRVAVDEEHGGARLRIVAGAREHDVERGGAAARRVPLAAVQAEAVTVGLGARAEVRGIGAGAGRGLGHAEGAGDARLDERAQILLPLRLAAGGQEQVHVALVGRVAVEDARADGRAAHLAEQHAHAHDAEPAAAPLRREVRRVEAGGARLGLQRSERVVVPLPILGEAHERRGPVLVAWDRAEIEAREPGHGGNVVLHELAHKLDMVDHLVDGRPPLHGRVDPQRWFDVCREVFTAMQEGEDRGPLDPYGATNPAEFFAVSGEAFFLAPGPLADAYPEFFTLLAHVFRHAKVVVPDAPEGTFQPAYRYPGFLGERFLPFFAYANGLRRIEVPLVIFAEPEADT